jgi:formamidopyrimidine-DNA glycosylase
MDQTVLSAIGNAYADEILFDAGLHPKTFCHQLKTDQVDRLYESIKRIIGWGIDEVERAGQPVDVKVRDHMRVRNRKGEPCPVCGTTVRREQVYGYDTFFCPKCQPSVRTTFISWEPPGRFKGEE